MNHTLCVAWLPSVISKLTLIINFNSRPVNLTLIFCLPSPRAHSRTVSPRLTRCTQSDAVRDRTGSATYIMHLFFLVLPAVQGMCAGWCSPALCSSVWKCMAATPETDTSSRYGTSTSVCTALR